MSDISIIVSSMLGLVLLVTLLTLGFWFFISIPQYKSICTNYGNSTNRQVKFEQPNWGTAACYVKTPNGWFDIDQINQNTIAK